MMQSRFDEEQWTQKLRSGARLLFWAAFLSAFLVNGIAFLLPLIGGTRKDLKWLALIAAAGSIGIALAVFSITTREPNGTPNRSIRRTMLRILAGLDALASLGTALVMPLSSSGNTADLHVARNFVRLGLACAFFLYVRSLAIRFGLEKLGRTAGTLAWVFPVASLAVMFRWDIFVGASQLSGPLDLWCKLALELAVGIWTLLFLWRFGSSMTSAAKGRCLRCGYLLVGLPETRCPECGTPFSPAWQLEHPLSGDTRA